MLYVHVHVNEKLTLLDIPAVFVLEGVDGVLLVLVNHTLFFLFS